MTGYEAPPRPDKCACQPGNLLDAHASRDKQAPGVRVQIRMLDKPTPSTTWRCDARIYNAPLQTAGLDECSRADGPARGGDTLLFARCRRGSTAPHESAMGDAG